MVERRRSTLTDGGRCVLSGLHFAQIYATRIYIIMTQTGVAILHTDFRLLAGLITTFAGTSKSYRRRKARTVFSDQQLQV